MSSRQEGPDFRLFAPGPICRPRSDSADLPRSVSSAEFANRIFNSMSDEPRQSKTAAPADQPAAPTEIVDLQRRRADVVDVLAETLVDLLLKQQRERRGGTAR